MTVYNQGPCPHFFLIPLNKYNGKVPFIVTDCIKRLDDIHSERLEGVFRIKGDIKIILELCNLLDNGKVQDWSKYQDFIADSVLKRYLQNLSDFDPLITQELTNKLKEIDANQTDDELVTIFHNFFETMYSDHISHRATLSTLFNYLDKTILPNFDQNRMDSNALTTCLFPTLFPSQDAEQILKNAEDCKKFTRFVRIMIDNFPKIFEESWYSPASKYTMTDEEIECLSMPKVNLEAAQIESDRRKIQKESMISFETQNQKLLQAYANRPSRPPPSIPQ